MHLLSLTLTFCICIIFHVIAISDFKCPLDQEDCNSDKIFIAGVVLIGISTIAIIMCLYYSISIQVRLIGGFSKKNQQNYRQFVPIIPNTQYNLNNPSYSYQRQ